MNDTRFHPNAPERLKTAFFEHGSYRNLADALGINAKYVHDLLAYGDEPSNLEIRLKLFLNGHPKSNKPSFPPGLDRIVLGILESHTGKENAIHRDTLLALVQPQQVCIDSIMRLAIQALREAGHRICNLETGGGYYIAANDKEYKEWVVKYTSRAYTIIKAKTAMDRNQEGQIPLFEEAENVQD